VQALLRSSYKLLLRAAKDEAKKVAKLEPPPQSYRFVTTQSLTVARKRELLKALSPFAGSEGHILGGEDVNVLLDAHPKSSASTSSCGSQVGRSSMLYCTLVPITAVASCSKRPGRPCLDTSRATAFWRLAIGCTLSEC